MRSVDSLFLIVAALVSVTIVPLVGQAASNPIEALPADASGILVVNSNPELWQDLSRFGLFPADFSTPGLLFAQFAADMNFSTEVAPWLGGSLGFGYMPDGKIAMIAPVQDVALAEKFLDRFVRKQSKSAQIVNHKGIKIQYWRPEKIQGIGQPEKGIEPREKSQEVEPPEAESDLFKIPGFAIALLPSGYMVRTETPETLKQLIDSEGQPRLSSKPEIQQLQQDPKYAKALVVGFGDYGKIIPAIQAEQTKQFKTLPPIPGMEIFQPRPETFAAIAKLYGGVDGLLWAEPQGLRMQVKISLKQPLPDNITQVNQSQQLLSQIPGTSFFVSNSHNLSALLQLFDLNLETDPALKNQTMPLRKLSQQFLGIDDRDLKTWMDKELSFFAFPSQQGFLARNFKIDLGFGLLVQTSDRAAGELVLGKLTKRLQENLGQSVKTQTRMVNGFPVVSLEAVAANPKGKSPKPSIQKPSIQKLSESQRQSFFSYSWVKPDTVLILSGVDSSQIPKPWQVLADSPNFKDAIAPLPNTNQGLFYVNGGASTAFIFNSLLPTFLGKEITQNPEFDRFKTSLGSVRSLSGTVEFKSNVMVSHGIVSMGAVKRSPLDAAGWLSAGEKRLKEGDADWAISNLTQAIAKNAQNSQAYLLRGQARAETSDFEGAIADFDQTLMLKPNPELTTQTYQQRGKAYFANHDYGNAIADLNRSIPSQVEDLPASYLMRSNASIETGNYRQAIADATQLIQLEPSLAPYSNRCYARARLGDFQAARSDCEQAEAQQVEDLPDQRFISRYCYVKVGLGDVKGLEYCQTAIAAEPENPHHYENQGLAYAIRRDNPKAMKSFEQSIELFKSQKNEYGVQRVGKLMDALK